MLANKSVTEYAKMLSSADPTPGGGSALAVIALNACALAEMAANVTTAKLARKNTDDKILADCSLKLAALREKIAPLIDGDATAFNKIISAMRMPHADERQSAARHEALQKAYADSAAVPLALIELCCEVYSHADTVVRRADEFVAIDARIGKDLIATVVKNSLNNVRINTRELCNKKLASEMEKMAEGLAKEVLGLPENTAYVS